MQSSGDSSVRMCDSNLPEGLIFSLRHVYAAAGMQTSAAPVRELEGSEYGACRLGLEGRSVVFREARVTPKKIGQFVTMWKRSSPDGPIAPLDAGDAVDFVVVWVAESGRRGQFVFDRGTLIDRDVMSEQGLGGKRAIRVYPPWSRPVAKQALATQRWQADRFLGVGADGGVDVRRVLGLFGA